MNRYNNTFQTLKTEDRIAFIPFWMIGDPTLNDSLNIIKSLGESADILELGMPFSDPLADGPTIQAAVNRSLDSGTNTQKCFEIIKSVREEFPDKPIGLLVYLNLILQFGIDKFFLSCQNTGVDSVLIPELPVEEIDLVKISAKKHEIDLVFLLSTNTPQERREKIFQHSGGFIYTVSKPSITGAKSELSSETLELVSSIKSTTSIPCCVGFGISSFEHIKKLKNAGADGAIIGSELINIYQEKGAEALDNFCKECQESTT